MKKFGAEHEGDKTMSIRRILVVDDDPDMRQMMTQFLRQNGTIALPAASESEVRSQLEGGRIDLILLDVMLGDENGLEICRKLRQEQDVPIIMVSALSADHQRMEGYSVGADDYIAKPFQPRELLARINSLLRRVPEKKKITIKGSFIVDTLHREIKMEGDLLKLTNKEYELLSFLVFNPGVIFSRDDLLKQIKGIEAKLFSRSIDILISRLRNKIEKNTDDPEFIKTIWGKGYTFINFDRSE